MDIFGIIRSNATASHSLNDHVYVSVCDVRVRLSECFAYVYVCVRDQHNKLFRMGKYLFSRVPTAARLNTLTAYFLWLLLLWVERRFAFSDDFLFVFSPNHSWIRSWHACVCVCVHTCDLASPHSGAISSGRCFHLVEKKKRVFASTNFHDIVHRIIIARVHRTHQTSLRMMMMFSNWELYSGSGAALRFRFLRSDRQLICSFGGSEFAVE